MEIREPKIIEMYADGKEFGTLTKEEIMENCPEVKIEEIINGWSSSCEYFSRYTDSEGVCRLDLERLVADGAPDYTRDAAVCVVIFTLIGIGRGEEIPEEILERAMPYIQARTAQMDYVNLKLKRMEDFALKALDELKRALDNDVSLDECYEKILSIAPSAESYSVIKQRYKEWYVPLFETLHRAAGLCSSQVYEMAMEEYLEAVS